MAIWHELKFRKEGAFVWTIIKGLDATDEWRGHVLKERDICIEITRRWNLSFSKTIK
jgi:hypothetical protein